MPSFWLENINSDTILHNKYGVYSKKELEEQLKLGYLTVEELGDLYSLTPFQIVHVLRSLGITFRNTLSDTRIPQFIITPSMHQIILGTLLGDAYMKTDSSYMLGHSINQAEYFYNVAENLGQAIATVFYKKSTLGKSLGFWTNCHDLFKPYAMNFYSEGFHKKVLSETAFYDLGAQGLAYWYMDDGKYGDYDMTLCTGGFSEPEVKRLVQFLKIRFNISSNEFLHKSGENRYWYIRIKAESRLHFISLIEPYVVPSMKYKLTGDPYPLLIDESLIAQHHLNLCDKIKRPIRFTGNENIEKVIAERCNIVSEKTVFINRIVEKIKNKNQVSYTQIRTEPTMEELKNLLEQGLNDSDIAKLYGFGRNRIAKLRRNMGIPKKSVRGKEKKFNYPCMNVKLVSTSRIESNEYNPNVVAHPEMNLLIQSIEKDGLTQPIVVFYDSDRDKYVVIDGFHRFTVLKDHFKYDKIPVVILKKSLNERMASTIRHNRARGRHQVDLMGLLVKNLYDQGWDDEAIASHLGMQGEELLRLRQQIGCADILSNNGYSKAWKI